MYPLIETTKAYLVAILMKQSTLNRNAHSAIDAFLNILGKNSIVITKALEPLDDIVVTSDPNPLDDIVVTTDPNPPVSLVAAIEELKAIAEGECGEEIKIAAQELAESLERVLEAISPLC